MDFAIFRLFIRVSLFVIALIACIIYLIRAYLKTKYSCTISTKSKWKQDGQKQERTQQAYHIV